MQRPNSETVSVYGHYMREIVIGDSDGKSLDLAARYVLLEALEVRASDVRFMLARANSLLEVGFQRVSGFRGS